MQPPPVRSVSLLVGLILAIIVGVLLVLRFVFPPAPKVDRAPLDQLGAVTVEQTARLLGSTGNIVVWRLPNNRQKLPGPQATLSAFDNRLAKITGLHVVAQEIAGRDLADVVSPVEIALPGGEFLALLEKHRTADALVLLGTAPVLEDVDYARLPAPRPKVIALCLVNHMPTRRLFDEHVLDMAIMPRLQPAPAGTPADSFHQSYMIVTAANAATSLR